MAARLLQRPLVPQIALASLPSMRPATPDPVRQPPAARTLACHLAVDGLLPKHLRKARQKWL